MSKQKTPSVPDQRAKAVVLLSGGLDSAVAAAIARNEGYVLYTLSFHYGQRHARELDSAAQVAHSLAAARHVVQHVDLRLFGGSALTDDIAVPKSSHATMLPQGIPVTYVPARNTIFLACALGYAETLGCGDLFIGVNAIDYAGYPDCRPEFIEAFERLARLGTRMGVEGRPIKVHAPLLSMSKADIVREGSRLGVDFALTHSCYDPREDGRSCGRCDSCRLRRQGFHEAGIRDPIHYADD